MGRADLPCVCAVYAPSLIESKRITCAGFLLILITLLYACVENMPNLISVLLNGLTLNDDPLDTRDAHRT